MSYKSRKIKIFDFVIFRRCLLFFEKSDIIIPMKYNLNVFYFIRRNVVFLLLLGFAWQPVFSQDTLYFKAKAFLSYKICDSAYYYINEAIKKDNNKLIYWQLKGDILFQQKHWDGAINSYLKTNKIKQNYVNYQLAKSYAQTGDYQKMATYLEKYLNQRNRIESYKIKLDTCFTSFSGTDKWQSIWMKDFDNAYQDFLKQIEYNIRYEHYTDALEQIDSYLINHPKKFYLYFLRGNILLIMKDKTSALTSYEKAHKLRSRNSEIAKAYGGLLFNLKKYKKARTIFVQLSNTNKYDLYPLREIGKCDYQLKKYEKAKQELLEFIKIYFKDPDANFYLAKTYFAKKAYFNALESINIAIRENPNNFDYLFTRGKIYLESQAYKLAVKDFLLALDINQSDNGELYFLIGIAYQHLCDPEMACSYWKRAYEHRYMEADEYRMKYCQ